MGAKNNVKLPYAGDEPDAAGAEIGRQHWVGQQRVGLGDRYPPGHHPGVAPGPVPNRLLVDVRDHV